MTELEYCVLGIVWQHAPLSAYSVRTRFSRSTTVGWSSSAGTVYPAVARLINARLIEAQKRQGGRRVQLLSVTENGRTALQNWLATVTPDLGSAIPDPIRTRVEFLNALRPQQQEQFLLQATEATRAALNELRSLLRTTAADEWSRMGQATTEGAVFQLKARLQWLATLTKKNATPDVTDGRRM